MKAKNVNLRADFALKVRELADIRCQSTVQLFNLLFNVPDTTLLQRMRDGLDSYADSDFTINGSGDLLGRKCLRLDGETHQRIKRIADARGFTIGQVVTLVLSVPSDTLLDYADEGINQNIETYNATARN